MNILKKLSDERYRESAVLKPIREKQNRILFNKEYFYEDTFDRGKGATTACIMKAIKVGLENKESNILMLDVSKAKINITFNLMKDYLTKARIIKKEYKHMMRIELINGSRIYFRSFNDIESSRGMKLDCVITENFQDMSEDHINRIHLFLCVSPIAEFIAISSRR